MDGGLTGEAPSGAAARPDVSLADAASTALVPAGPSPAGRHAARRRLSWLGTLASASIFVISVVVLWGIARETNVSELAAAFRAASLRQIALVALLTATSYLLLTGYDFLALRQMKVRIPYRTMALASFTSYAVSFTLGFPLVTGGTVRYWIYAPKGLRMAQVASITVIAGITFWLGMGAILGWSLIDQAGAIAVLANTRVDLNRAVGAALLAALSGYFAWVSMQRQAVTIQGWRLELPGFRVSLGQMLIGAGDVCAGAGVLFVLLPAGHGIGFETFLAIYVFACMLGTASNAPGGLGVFEATILLALSGLPREGVLGALLLFRLCYYLVPFVLALTMLGAYEGSKRLIAARRATLTSDSDVT